MPTIDLGKVKGEDGKDGGFSSVELLQTPILEGEVFNAQEGTLDGTVQYPKWNIPLQFGLLKTPPKLGDIISIEFESPYAGRNGFNNFIIDFKCVEAESMAFSNNPILLTVCHFRICNIMEICITTGYYTSLGKINFNMKCDDFVLLGGIDSFEYIHGLSEFMKYADENCGGVIEGLGSTTELRAEVGDGSKLNLQIHTSGDDISPWWKYASSASTDTSGNISALTFALSQTYGNFPPAYEGFGIIGANNSCSLGIYCGQYMIKSVRYKESI